MYTLTSRNKQKRVELTESAEGIQLVLKNEGNATPYFAGRLNEMLTYSSGRPWNHGEVRLESTQVSLSSGAIRIQGKIAVLSFRMELRFDERNLMRLDVEWENGTEDTLRDAAAGLLFPLPRYSGERITIPHMIYNNNPSSDPSRIVPKLGIGEGLGLICEEHRLPIPCVNMEWTKDNESRYFSLFSVPSYVEASDGSVHYGSMGAIQEEQRLVIAAMSGVLMFNGEKDTVYMGKSKTAPYDGGYTDFTPGFILSKEYALDWGPVAVSGQGFREIVRAGLQLFDSAGAKPHTPSEMIGLKANALDDRWRTNDAGAAGYIKFSDSNTFGNVSKRPLHYMYGWTGQCLKLAWCDAMLGVKREEERRVARCRQAVDFYVRESRTAIPGLRHGAYRLEEQQWDDFSWNKQTVVSSRAAGETAADLAEIILLFQSSGIEVPLSWTEALRESADFFLKAVLPSGIVPSAWQLDGVPADEMINAAGLPCLIAILKAYRVTGEASYLKRAEAMMQKYAELHVETFERPFARSTLDAKCEDKEAGMYFFLAAYELYLATNEDKYAAWAELSADWLLTFVYVWQPVYNRGTLFREKGFNAVGWPGVSVQNHHLDVFFPTYEMWNFGKRAGKPRYEQWGRVCFDAMGQGICAGTGDWNFTIVGEQGEGFFQTNWHHRGHSNKWNPSWVIAAVLSNALRFQEEVE
ncbi:hypothetical protein CF651_02425 [Paenibacillus rigui]|uniref:Uncharacterized protein n=1 Tax=Paenibacillus rigui TaxID=554312 RepID=A0A229UXQ0_9BACL|nr:hypothetical protein CF651_02425 [Paenibacillus rigui]